MYSPVKWSEKEIFCVISFLIQTNSVALNKEVISNLDY